MKGRTSSIAVVPKEAPRILERVLDQEFWVARVKRYLHYTLGTEAHYKHTKFVEPDFAGSKMPAFSCHAFTHVPQCEMSALAARTCWLSGFEALSFDKLIPAGTTTPHPRTSATTTTTIVAAATTTTAAITYCDLSSCKQSSRTLTVNPAVIRHCSHLEPMAKNSFRLSQVSEPQKPTVGSCVLYA